MAGYVDGVGGGDGLGLRGEDKLEGCGGGGAFGIREAVQLWLRGAGGRREDG